MLHEFWSRTRLRLKVLVRRRQLDQDLEDELAFHLAMRADQQHRTGTPTNQTDSAARRQFGNTTLLKEDCRSMWTFPSLETIWQDVCYGARMLRKHPTFTAVTMLTLAMGIGANTALFSVVHAVLLEPLPYPQPAQLVMVWERVRLPHYQNERNTPAPGNFADWQTRHTVFSGMGAIRYRSWSLTDGGEPVRIEGEAVSAGFFPALQVSPLLGRTFTAEEDRPGGPAVAILSHSLWSERFGSNPQVVGSTIHLDGAGYTVIGIMPLGFHFPDPDDLVWVPLAMSPSDQVNHGSHYLRIVARLRPQVTLAQAQAQMDTIAQQLSAQYPDTNSSVGVNIVPLREQVVGDVRPALLVLFGAVALVLLMVCANVASLLLARGAARQREMAIRAALGAGRTRLLRQLLTESLLLALFGGLLGILLAHWGVRGLESLSPPDLPRIGSIGLNAPVLGFSLGVSLLAGLVFGVAPALASLRSDLREPLAEGSRGSAGGPHGRLRGLLVASELALGVVVLAGAGLLLRSFVVLQNIPLGLDSSSVLTFRVILPAARYATYEQRSAFYQRLLEKLESIPEVRCAGGVSFLPLTFAGRTTAIAIEGSAPVPANELPFADFRMVTPGYFRTLGIALAEGRDFAWSDSPAQPPAVVVSQTLARTFWPGENPIGKRLKLGGGGPQDPWLSVIGVVGDVHQMSRTREPRPAVYLSATQDVGVGDTVRDWAVRSSGDPLLLAPAVRGAVWSVDAVLPVSRVQTMERVLSGTLASQQFNLLLLGLFALLALVLAAVGLYGVSAYFVAQRTRELGVRMALGAERRDVLALVLRMGARLIGLGIVVGLAASLAAGRLLASLLFQVSPRDPLVLAGVAVLLAAVALLACYLPARRATHVDPVIALRHE
jgi:putative ABC transport system permease protein